VGVSVDNRIGKGLEMMNLDTFDAALEQALATGDVDSLEGLLEIAEREAAPLTEYDRIAEEGEQFCDEMEEAFQKRMRDAPMGCFELDESYELMEGDAAAGEEDLG